jgi:hypothetical protein
MSAPAKRVAMLGLAAFAVLAAVLILVFSGGDNGQHRRTRTGPAGQSDVQVAAGYLGISTADLRRRLRSGLTLAQVADTGNGTSSGGLFHALLLAHAAAIKRRGLSSGEERERLAAISHRLKNELGRARRGHSRELTLASGYLGLEADALLSRLASGQSQAEIASATAGKSRSGLIKALTGPRERRLRAAAADHQLTATAAQAAIDTFRARTTREVDRKDPAGAG